MSSRVFSSASSCAFHSAVMAGKASGGSSFIRSSRSLISWTIGQSRFSRRSFALPKTRVRMFAIGNAVLFLQVPARSSRGHAQLSLDPHDRLDAGAEEALAHAHEAFGD